MTNPPNNATTESLWGQKQLLLLEEGAIKTVLIGLFSYCLLGALTLRYYYTEMLVSLYIFISVVIPLLLLASWYGLLVNNVLFKLFSPFSANDILRWWPIAVSICIRAYFLVEIK